MFSRGISMLLGPLVLASILFGAGGCSRAPESGPPGRGEDWDKAFSGEMLLGVSPEYLEKYQPDVRMVAYWSKGWVEVRVKNHTDGKINVSPANFGAIAPRGRGGGGELVAVEPGVARSLFPNTTLEPETLASGWFKFYELGNLEGGFLVFNHPDPNIRPSRCEIKSRSPSP